METGGWIWGCYEEVEPVCLSDHSVVTTGLPGDFMDY